MEMRMPIITLSYILVRSSRMHVSIEICRGRSSISEFTNWVRQSIHVPNLALAYFNDNPEWSFDRHRRVLN